MKKLLLGLVVTVVLFSMTAAKAEIRYDFEMALTGFINPGGIAVDASGNICVADEHRIQKFAPDGTLISVWEGDSEPRVLPEEPAPEPGPLGRPHPGPSPTDYGAMGEGEFSFPRGIAIDSTGNVYVADEGNHRIQKLTAAGEFITAWGSEGSGDGQFESPMDVAIDSSRNFVYVADYLNHRIQKFDLDGNFLAKWGSYGSGDNQFSGPVGVAIDSSGNIFVADVNNHRIQRLTSSGEFLVPWDVDSVFDVAVDASGNVYVAGYSDHRIQKFNSEGILLTSFGSYGSGDGQFYHPVEVTLDSAGNIYVADRDRVQKFTILESETTTTTRPRVPRGIMPREKVTTTTIGKIHVEETTTTTSSKITTTTTRLWVPIEPIKPRRMFP